MRAWEQFLKKQDIALGKETVDKWLRSLKIHHYDACNIYLEASDNFQVVWFEEHVRVKTNTQLVNNNGKKIKVHLTASNAAPLENKKSRPKKKNSTFTSPSFTFSFDALNPLNTFDQFVLTEENLLTYKLLREMVSPQFKNHASPIQIGTLNPIYLYGGHGSGKTHLLMSMAHLFEAHGLKTVYTRAEAFTDHVVSAIRAGEMSRFRQAYRNIDVLLVDDIHVFSRKGATQEEFFHTFNTLHMEGKQIILAAECAPQELHLIEPRLVSRFEWGIVLQLKPLKAEEMVQLLKSKTKAMDFPLSPPIVEFLLGNFQSNPKALVRALEALMLRLHLGAEETPLKLNIPTVKTLLADLLLEEEKSAITPEKIVHATAEHYGILTDDILGKSQKRECAMPRKLAMHLCRDVLKLPYMKIGDLFGRDHSTVMSSIKHIQEGLVKNDSNIMGSLYSINKKLQT